MAENGIDSAIIGRSGAHCGSSRTCSARKGAEKRIAIIRITEMVSDIASPARKVLRPFFTLAAARREMDVWIGPAQSAKAIPWIGNIIW